MEPSPVPVACGSVKCLPMAKTVIRVMFDDATAAEGFLERCRGEGLDAVVEDARPIGTVKRNGPGLASWLKAHPGWHVVAESVNRRAAWAAAWKIRHGERRGFEDGLWDAQAQNRDGRQVGGDCPPRLETPQYPRRGHGPVVLERCRAACRGLPVEIPRFHLFHG